MYKSKLQELCHKKDWELPVYTTVQDGPDHCPRFTSTVTVRGQTFESPMNFCKSSKEAQNFAAKIAFEHLYSAQSVSPVIISPSPGFLDKKLQQKQGQNAQTSLADQSLVSCRDEIRPKDLHVYKNRLQHYAQKKNVSLPEYSCEIDGPPHARRFRASVKIGGSTYISPAYFATLKDSEHAAAKVAFESLSVGEVQEDEGLYKTLLQELAQKKGFRFPSYTTVTIGSPHMATFVSTVEIAGESFEGRECKTKKLSEMNAAKIAYNDLMEREASRYCYNADRQKGNTEVRAGCSQPISNHDNRGANNATETYAELRAMRIDEIHSSHSVLHPGDLKNNAVDSVVTYILQQDIQPKSVSSVNENDGKPRESSTPVSEKSDVEKPLSDASDAEKPGGDTIARGPKIVILPRSSTTKIPQGATILPFSDDKWVAAKVEAHQQQ